MAIPPWLSSVLSSVVGLAALAVLVWDDADTTWQLSSATTAILGGLIAGLVGWQIPSPHDPPKPLSDAAIRQQLPPRID